MGCSRAGILRGPIGLGRESRSSKSPNSVTISAPIASGATCRLESSFMSTRTAYGSCTFTFRCGNIPRHSNIPKWLIARVNRANFGKAMIFCLQTEGGRSLLLLRNFHLLWGSFRLNLQPAWREKQRGQRYRKIWPWGVRSISRGHRRLSSTAICIRVPSRNLYCPP